MLPSKTWKIVAIVYGQTSAKSRSGDVVRGVIGSVWVLRGNYAFTLSGGPIVLEATSETSIKRKIRNKYGAQFGRLIYKR